MEKQKEQLIAKAKQEVAREIFEELEKNPVVMKRCIFIDKKHYDELKKKYIGEKEVNQPCCKYCKHLMFSDCYGECSKGYKGIVNPYDSCEHFERKLRQ